jgi:acetyl esterase/lipase
MAGAIAMATCGCRVTSLPLWEASKAAKSGFEVERIKDIAYYEKADADKFRHRLDLFLPKGMKDYPVVILVHGGAWIMGDNRSYGLYSSVGEFLASQGIGAVLPNYRLSPAVKHPRHVQDVAQVFAWTRKHIAAYGGSPEKLFLAGHSAGGHLVALLATDERYLEDVGEETTSIKGVIAVSGVYRIPPGPFVTTLGGDTPNAFHLRDILPVRGVTASANGRAVLPGIPLRLNVFGPAFGDDPQFRAAASPVNHVRPGLPPFLLFCAERDLPTLPGMAEEFYQALRSNGCAAELRSIKNRNHNSVMLHAIEPDDPVARAMVEFIGRQSRE